jgi:hypothetical protein
VLTKGFIQTTMSWGWGQHLPSGPLSFGLNVEKNNGHQENSWLINLDSLLISFLEHQNEHPDST